MRKLECELCGAVGVPGAKWRRKQRKKMQSWSCKRCGHKNKAEGRRRGGTRGTSH